MLNSLFLIFSTSDFFAKAVEKGWFHDLLNTIIGAAIGSGVTIWALYSTFKHDKKKEEENRIQFQKEKAKYFQSLIKTINTDLNTQIGYFTMYAERIRQNPVELPIPTHLPLSEVDRIVNKINHEDYYHAYLDEFGEQQTSIDEFREMISSLNFFDENLLFIKTSLEKSIHFNHDRHIMLKSLIEMIVDDASELLMNQDFLKNHTELWESINNQMLNFHEEEFDEHDLHFYNDNFITPLKDILIQYNRKVPVSHHLIVLLKKATSLYHSIQLHNLNVAKDFEKWQEAMMNEYKEFQNSTKRLLNYNT